MGRWIKVNGTSKECLIAWNEAYFQNSLNFEPLFVWTILGRHLWFKSRLMRLLAQPTYWSCLGPPSGHTRWPRRWWFRVPRPIDCSRSAGRGALRPSSTLTFCRSRRPTPKIRPRRGRRAPRHAPPTCPAGPGRRSASLITFFYGQSLFYWFMMQNHI